MLKELLNYVSSKSFRKWKTKVNTSNLTTLELYVLDYMLHNNKLDFYMRYRNSHYDKEEYRVSLDIRNKRRRFNLFHEVEVYIVVCDESGKKRSLNEYINSRNNIFEDHYWEIPISSIYSTYLSNEYLN